MVRHVTGLGAVAALAALVCFALCWVSASAASLHLDDGERKPWMDEMEANLQNDLYLSELVSRLRALNDAEVAGLAHKRGFDFGLGRGFSASQAAKHKMGLEAAEFPSGPGRRRRSLEQDLRH
ncbi:diuretic hormone class 2-like [Amphibalanus amphitrite]|uniref:Calcitonin-like diuretic hormone A n=1 Tax=Amphibalanus amphitrite TaxID=1232801 RepID=I3VN97_AMPAM|nr:diuretic hormone class 2-like [Amphibalanus amphitrite]AFK81934.1 calcitonin-like diuretic hormone A [Amphibalanus amphitrite]